MIQIFRGDNFILTFYDFLKKIKPISSCMKVMKMYISRLKVVLNVT